MQKYKVTDGVTVLGSTSTVTHKQLEDAGSRVRTLIKSGAITLIKPEKKSKKAAK